MSQITNLDKARAKILAYPDPVLREVSRPIPVDDEKTMALVQQCVGALKETMRGAAGWGLSAIQIGVPIRVFVVHVQGETTNPIVFVNPEIVASSPRLELMPEGCLSFPGSREMIERPASVVVKRYDERGRLDTSEFRNWTARAVQHEMDHLQAVLLVDYLMPAARKMFEKKRRREGKRCETEQLTA